MAGSKEKERYLRLHSTNNNETSGSYEQLRTAPLISLSAKDAAPPGVDFPQYGFLGCQVPNSSHPPSSSSPALSSSASSSASSQSASASTSSEDHDQHIQDPDPILLNTNAPSSTFICGSQGSGKSHTLSCILEICLYASPAIGKLPSPLAGVVFHNSSHTGSGIVCEAAHLASLDGMSVDVLVSRSNFRGLKKLYEGACGAKGNVRVRPLVFKSGHLNTERMHRLMAFSEGAPLYMEVIMRILRDMAIASDTFSYPAFRYRLDGESFAPGQKQMMDMRLNLLESFLDMDGTSAAPMYTPKASESSQKKKKKTFQEESPPSDDIFRLRPGTLTIVDLSDPFLDASTVCTLFDITLSLISERRPPSGLVVALDEAHKFLSSSSSSSATTTSSGADILTENLLTTIREQRHNATRVVIATQEPTLSPRLLDLCSMTFVHRFSSPEWLATLSKHLAGASSLSTNNNIDNNNNNNNNNNNAKALASQQDGADDDDDAGVSAEESGGGGGGLATLFSRIVGLDAGESLVFAPEAVLRVGDDGAPARKLGADYVKFKTRLRLGVDGGRSVLAIREERK